MQVVEAGMGDQVNRLPLDNASAVRAQRLGDLRR
jgi:hypothetical protein